MTHCPNCGNRAIRASKMTFTRELIGRDFELYQFWCPACHFGEDAESDRPDFDERYARWDSVDDEPAS